VKLPVTRACDGRWICFEEGDILAACRRAGCDWEMRKACLECFRNPRVKYECSDCFFELCDMGVDDFEYREEYKCNASAIYDKEARSLYIRFLDMDSKVARTKELRSCTVLVDLDENENIVGIEIAGIQMKGEENEKNKARTKSA